MNIPGTVNSAYKGSEVRNSTLSVGTVSNLTWPECRIQHGRNYRTLEAAWWCSVMKSHGSNWTGVTRTQSGKQIL